MRCPECTLENGADAKRCARCGADLTQAVLMTGESHRTDQVWNTDIETERNKQNTKVAMAVLAVGAVLTVVLVAILLLWLPRNLSFSMPEISITELLEEYFEPESVPVQPEPDIPPAMKIDGADLDFINVFAAYVIELRYAEDTDMQREIHQMFYPEFEYLCMQEFSYDQLYGYTRWVLDLNRILGASETDRVEYLQALHELSVVVLTVNEGFYFLSDEPEVLDYYADTQWHTQAVLEVEYDLQNQLIGTGTQWSDEYDCEAISYTNNTVYTLDITFYNDFVTDEAHYSDAFVVMGLMPDETAIIPLYALSDIGEDEDHTWHIDWNIDECYLDGVPLWEQNY